MSFPEAHRQWLDAGVVIPDPEGERVPVTVPGIYETLQIIARELGDLIALQRQVLAALGTPTASQSRSSVELEDMASGKTKVTTKSYDGSPIGNLGDEAIAEHGRVKRRLEERILANWAAEVECGEYLGIANYANCELPRGHAGAHGFAT